MDNPPHQIPPVPAISPEPPVIEQTSTAFHWLAGIAVLCTLSLPVVYFFLSQKLAGNTPPPMRHVGILNALDYFSPAIDGFKQKMTSLGYIEGKNITYDIQKSAVPVGNQAIVKKFVDEKVDLIFAFPTEASLEAKEGTRGTAIPVVGVAFGMEGSGLVDSVQNPGGNVTGVRFPIPEASVKRLEVLHQLVPKATRVLVPYLKDYPSVAAALPVLEPAAQSFGITLLETPFSTLDEMNAYFAARGKDIGFDAVLLIPEPLSTTRAFREPLFAFTDAHKIPVVAEGVTDTDMGALYGASPDGFDLGQLAAPLADKIFRGVSPGKIPIVTPELVLSINLKAIQRIGLIAGDNLISTANKIVH